MKKSLFLFILISLSTYCRAYDVCIDGIYYDIVNKIKEAHVTKGDGVSSYTGNIVIPSSITVEGVDYTVTRIKEATFSYSWQLHTVTIPNTIQKIEKEVFSNCYNLESVAIPNSVTSIEKEAFYNCSKLKSLEIPNTVTYIGAFAFYKCSSLTSIKIPSSVTSIDVNGFGECTSLESVHIDDLVAWCSIEFGGSSDNPLNYAHHLFLNGVEIKDLVIPNIGQIRNFSFYGCTGLTSVTIPSSITSIGWDAFGCCTGLKSIRIPDSVKELKAPFDGCSGLESVVVDEHNTEYDSRNNCNAIIESKTNTLLFGCKKTIIPNTVARIDHRAFYKCIGLTSIKIPDSVKEIGRYAFERCSDLKSITIGSGITSIDNCAFMVCENIEEVTCYAKDIPQMGVNVFLSSYVEYATLNVPKESVDKYKAANQWKDFGKIKAIESTGIGNIATFTSTTNKVFDISGKRLQHPAHGINIINGKKVVVK